jgi:hypothetical protein
MDITRFVDDNSHAHRLAHGQQSASGEVVVVALPQRFSAS